MEGWIFVSIFPYRFSIKKALKRIGILQKALKRRSLFKNPFFLTKGRAMEGWGITRGQLSALLAELREDPSWRASNSVYDLVRFFIIPRTRGSLGFLFPEGVCFFVPHVFLIETNKCFFDKHMFVC